MRRFSQRNSLVTLSDINITPLLDLAFVLLIIFIITTPLLEKGMDLQLPTGVGHQDKSLNKKDIHVVEVNTQGAYVLDHHPMKLDQLARTLEDEYRLNPNLLVFIRGDENGRYKYVADVLDRCQEIGITKISLRSDSRAHP
jgi:biopolymer transport protein ExbD